MPDIGELAFEDRLSLLLEREKTERAQRRYLRLKSLAKLHLDATIEDLDFKAPRGLDRSLVLRLASGQWIRDGQTVLVNGPPGVGKTHLGISLAITAAQNGRKIYFGTLTDLVDSLEEAKAAGRLNRRLKTLTQPALLVVDEIGYLPVTQSGAVLFFQLIYRRYGHASTVLTSNKGFEEWGRILGDEVMAAALLDRLLHRCHIVNIRGNSYRMRRHAELSKAIHPVESRTNCESMAGETRS